MKLTGAAILVSRGMKFLLAAPAAYPYRYHGSVVPLDPDRGLLGHPCGLRAARRCRSIPATIPASISQWDRFFVCVKMRSTVPCA